MSKEKILRRLLAGSLKQPEIELRYDLNLFRVRGKMAVGDTYARIEIIFHRKFKVLKQVPPEVWCSEPWVKRNIDWHAYHDGGLCWVLPPQWRDLQAWQGKPKKTIAVDGSRWLLESVNLLLSRHRWAHLEGVNEWQDDWDEWAHYGAGVEEYEQQRKHKTMRSSF